MISLFLNKNREFYWLCQLQIANLISKFPYALYLSGMILKNGTYWTDKQYN